MGVYTLFKIKAKGLEGREGRERWGPARKASFPKADSQVWLGRHALSVITPQYQFTKHLTNKIWFDPSVCCHFHWLSIQSNYISYWWIRLSPRGSEPCYEHIMMRGKTKKYISQFCMSNDLLSLIFGGENHYSLDASPPDMCMQRKHSQPLQPMASSWSYQHNQSWLKGTWNADSLTEYNIYLINIICVPLSPYFLQGREAYWQM